MSWAVKKASLQAKEGRNRHGANEETSRPFFLPEEPKRKISRAIVGPLGPGVHYLLVYWASGPSRGQGPTRGGEAFVRRDSVEK